MTPEQLQKLWDAGRLAALAGPAASDQQALAAAIGPDGLGPLQERWGPGVAWRKRRRAFPARIEPPPARERVARQSMARDRMVRRLVRRDPARPR